MEKWVNGGRLFRRRRKIGGEASKRDGLGETDTIDGSEKVGGFLSCSEEAHRFQFLSCAVTGLGKKEFCF